METESTNEIDNEINMNAQTSDQILLVEQEETIEKEKNNLVGIFDPADNDLSINMWEFSDKNTIIKKDKKIIPKDFKLDFRFKICLASCSICKIKCYCFLQK